MKISEYGTITFSDAERDRLQKEVDEWKEQKRLEQVKQRIEAEKIVELMKQEHVEEIEYEDFEVVLNKALEEKKYKTFKFIYKQFTNKDSKLAEAYIRKNVDRMKLLTYAYELEGSKYEI